MHVWRAYGSIGIEQGPPIEPRLDPEPDRLRDAVGIVGVGILTVAGDGQLGGLHDRRCVRDGLLASDRPVAATEGYISALAACVDTTRSQIRR